MHALRFLCLIFASVSLVLTGCLNSRMRELGTNMSDDALIWLRETCPMSASGIAFNVSILRGHNLEICFSESPDTNFSDGPELPYMFSGDSDVFFDDLIFRESWHTPHAMGVTLVFVSQDNRVYGCSSERAYIYGWSPGIKAADSVAPGSHVRLLKHKEELKRSIEIFPLVKGFLDAYPECRGMKGQFMLVARVPLLAPTQGGFREVRCVYKVVEVPESIAARAVAK
jgi:hypothetical protein